MGNAKLQIESDAEVDCPHCGGFGYLGTRKDPGTGESCEPLVQCGCCAGNGIIRLDHIRACHSCRHDIPDADLAALVREAL